MDEGDSQMRRTRQVAKLMRQKFPDEVERLSALYGDAYRLASNQWADAAAMYFLCITSGNASAREYKFLGVCYDIMVVNAPHEIAEEKKEIPEVLKQRYLLPSTADSITPRDIKSWKAMLLMVKDPATQKKIFGSTDPDIHYALDILKARVTFLKDTSGRYPR
jgi:hypothetical protein